MEQKPTSGSSLKAKTVLPCVFRFRQLRGCRLVPIASGIHIARTTDQKAYVPLAMTQLGTQHLLKVPVDAIDNGGWARVRSRQGFPLLYRFWMIWIPFAPTVQRRKPKPCKTLEMGLDHRLSFGWFLYRFLPADVGAASD